MALVFVLSSCCFFYNLVRSFFLPTINQIIHLQGLSHLCFAKLSSQAVQVLNKLKKMPKQVHITSYFQRFICGRINTTLQRSSYILVQFMTLEIIVIGWPSSSLYLWFQKVVKGRKRRNDINNSDGVSIICLFFDSIF